MGEVVFLHPDLGIGGAERLVVDAALALKTKGYAVNIVTTHHDKSHAFRETVNGDVSVVVVGDWIPRSIFHHFHAVMAYLRMIYAAFYIIAFSSFNPDVVFCDVVSVAIPVLKLRCKNVIFYCHFPDKLLSQPKGVLKALYRAPIDWLEEVCLAKATHVFVNSQFTASVVRDTFKNLTFDLDILYPSLNMSFFDSFSEFVLPASLEGIISNETVCFLSINRYERKKDLHIALEAFSELKQMISERDWNNVHLVIAGGYDYRVIENVEHLEELKKISSDFKLNNKVTFLTSISDAEKISLIKMSTCLIYTPSNEHFGIVPIEAMYMSKPVIAANNGGPKESILNGETGFLCEPTPICFAEAMKKFVSDKTLSSNLGAAGRRRVSSLFSFENFAEKLSKTVCQLTRQEVKKHDRQINVKYNVDR